MACCGSCYKLGLEIERSSEAISGLILPVSQKHRSGTKLMSTQASCVHNQTADEKCSAEVNTLQSNNN